NPKLWEFPQQVANLGNTGLFLKRSRQTKSMSNIKLNRDIMLLPKLQWGKYQVYGHLSD
ncbi:Hypothetical predicted protein, partial [Marmota monax]